MTAAEARKKAQENLERSTQFEFNDIMDHIEIAVKEGKFETTYYSRLSYQTIQRLENEPNNYKVTQQTHGGCYEITW